jgi:1-acyl-sn-glycerol-3-phosphate acyltransferase
LAYVYNGAERLVNHEGWGSAVAVWALAALIWAVTTIAMKWRRSGLPWDDFEILDGSRISSLVVHRWRSKGFTHLPSSGPALLISNHTCSADPPFLLGGSPRVLSFLVAHEHYDVHPFTTWLLNTMGCVKVRRECPDPKAVREGLRRLAEGKVFTMFPEGGLSGVARKRLLRGKHGAAWLALVSRAPVFAVYIEGGPRTPELLNSWIRPAKRRVQVVFGPRIDLSRYYDKPRTRQLLEEVTRFLMRHIAHLDPKKKHGNRDEPGRADAPHGG